MANNERVKLTADIMEAAGKHNCNVPKEAIQEILNDSDNKKVFGTDDYDNVSKVISEAKNLIGKRKKAIDEYY